MHVQRFQDSNERTDKNPWLGLRRVSVKQNPNLTITLNLKQHSLKIKDRLRPRPRVLLTPVCKENCGRGQARSLWRFFCQKARCSATRSETWWYSADRSFNGSREKWILLRWDIFMLCDAPHLFKLFLDFHFILEVVVPQDDNRNCWRMLKATEHHRSFWARIKLKLLLQRIRDLNHHRFRILHSSVLACMECKILTLYAKPHVWTKDLTVCLRF